MGDFHSALGLEVNASPQQIQSAYLYWALELNEEPRASGSRTMEQLQRAYSALTGPSRRPQPRPVAERFRPTRSGPRNAPKASAPVRFCLRESLGG